jgi:hypothetical protein
MRTKDNDHDWFGLAEKLWSRDSSGTQQFTENALVNCHGTESKDGQQGAVLAATGHRSYERIHSRI